MSPIRTMVGKLGLDARKPRYIFTESRVGYWMPKGEGVSNLQQSLEPTGVQNDLADSFATGRLTTDR